MTPTGRGTDTAGLQGRSWRGNGGRGSRGNGGRLQASGHVRISGMVAGRGVRGRQDRALEGEDGSAPLPAGAGTAQGRRRAVGAAFWGALKTSRGRGLGKQPLGI